MSKTSVTKQQLRELEKLERQTHQSNDLSTKLRFWAGIFAVPEEHFLKPTKVSLHLLRPELSDDRMATWPTFDLLFVIAEAARNNHSCTHPEILRYNKGNIDGKTQRPRISARQ